MKAADNKVLIPIDDYVLLNACVKNTKAVARKEPHHSPSLSEELQKAVVVEKSELPADVVCLDAQVTVKDLQTGQETTLMLVLPEFADIKLKKVSVLAPMGTALIGLQKGQRFEWHMPAGKKSFLILNVKREG